MDIKKVAKLSPKDRFMYWAIERNSIRLKKEAGWDKPWTDDTILQAYRFCNPVRMDDRVSDWLYDNWYKPNLRHRGMVKAVALARLINNPASLDSVGFPKVWNPQAVIKVLKKRRDQGETVFNAAYIVSTCGVIADKIEHVVNEYVSPFNPQIDTTSMEKSWETIKTYNGFGSFMAGQVVADLRWAVQGTWKDKNYWAPLGPGSKRGMNRLLGRPITQTLSQSEFLDNLQELIGDCLSNHPQSIFQRMEAHDYQNCCCEFDKYERALYDGRRPKQLYQGL